MRARYALVLLAVAPVSLLLAVPAGATPAIDVQANNPQVAGQSNSNSTAVFPTNKQNEPTIAADPLNAPDLIAGSNDEQLQPPCGPGPVRGPNAAASDCSFFPNVGTDGAYTSSNGGKTWTNRGLLPGFSDNGGSLVSDGDPVIVFGPAQGGNGKFSWSNGSVAYYGSLASFASGQSRTAPEMITVSRSRDDGLHWTNPVVAASGHGFIFNDKPDIWVDRNASSPFFGRVYVTWTQFRDIPGCAEPIMFTESADGGKTWSVPNQLSTAHNCGLGGRQGSVVRTGPDGTVYVEWEDSDQQGSDQVIAASADGGVSFSHATKIAHVTDLADPIPGANFRTDSFASVAVNQTSGTVYVSWSDASAGAGLIEVSAGTNHGTSWTAPQAVSAAAQGYAFYQGLDVAPNGRIDVGFQALTAKDPSTYGTGNATINSYYVESSDGGVSWSVPVRVTNAGSDPAASAQNDLTRQFWGDYNTLVSTNSNAWFIYTDSRNGVGCPAVDAYQHSVDAGSPITKPAPENVCASQFGNSDVFVSTITP
jgi:hypothetical protein